MSLEFLRDSSREKEAPRCPRTHVLGHHKLGIYLGIVYVFCLIADNTSGSEDLPPPCDSQIYCYGDLLHTVQMASLYADSKTFVDMKMKYSVNETLERFQVLMDRTSKNPTRHEIADFVNKTFDPAGSEFEEWSPNDWVEWPKLLNNISDEYYRNWAVELNRIWKFLGRKMRDEVKKNPEYYSIIYVPHPVIVPGGRFREFYYWDSYWIVKGLLRSEMYHTVRGMLENFLSVVNKFGFIPNGGRVYYLMRSQPPLLVPMVEAYYDATDDLKFLKEALPILEKEFNFWMTNRTVLVEKDGKSYTLARFYDRSQGPRPESYREDYSSAVNIKSSDEKIAYYSELKAAAESGWDFSTRWYIKNGTNKGELQDTKTKSIIPVELNAEIYWNAVILSRFFKKIGEAEKSIYYSEKAAQWKEAVTQVLWHEEVGVWLDYDLLNEVKRDYFYPTNVAPLWTECYDLSKKDEIVGRVMKYIEKSQAMQFLGGIPSTLEHSGEQWDYPNAWPPLQYIMIVGLYNTRDAWAQELAFTLADKWIKSNYRAFNETHAMYEKVRSSYDATVVGMHGGGGEYETQLGFGWSNGVVMELLHIFGKRLKSFDDFETEVPPPLLRSSGSEQVAEIEEIIAASSSSSLIAPLVITAILFVGLFLGGGIWFFKSRESSTTGRSNEYRRFYRGADYTELKNFTYE